MVYLLSVKSVVWYDVRSWPVDRHDKWYVMSMLVVVVYS